MEEGGVVSSELQREVEQGRAPQTLETPGTAGSHPSPYFPGWGRLNLITHDLCNLSAGYLGEQRSPSSR